MEARYQQLSADEVFTLRQLARRPNPPWWQNYPLLIAAAGFALSLVTAIIAAYTSHRRDVHDRQAELAMIMQTIPELSIRQAEVYEKYKGTDFEMIVANLLTAHINTLLRTASELALRLGGEATTAELTSIAQGIYGVGDFATAEQLLTTALQVAKNANDESIALRYLGAMKIRSATTPEERKEGEDLFAQAAALDEKHDLAQLPYAIHFLKATAHFSWADAIASFDCTSARTHFAEGVRNLVANPRTPEMDQMRRAVLASYTKGIGQVGTCGPPSEPPLER